MYRPMGKLTGWHILRPVGNREGIAQAFRSEGIAGSGW